MSSWPPNAIEKISLNPWVCNEGNIVELSWPLGASGGQS